MDCSNALNDERIDQSFILFAKPGDKPSSELIEFDCELKKNIFKKIFIKNYNLLRCSMFTMVMVMFMSMMFI